MPNKTLEKWEEKTLEEICEKISAGGDKPEIFSETKTIECNIPIYSNGIKDNGLYGYTNNPTIEKPAITISARGTIGFICKRLEPYCPIVRLISLIPKDFIDLSFLAYAMNFIIPKNTGTSIPQLTVPNLKTSKIQYPSLSEQQRIVKILDEAFENIEKAKQNALQNLNNAKELFESFLDELFTKNTNNWNKYKVKDLCEYAKEQGHYNLPYVGMEHIKSSAAEFIGTLDNTEVKSTTFHFDKGIILYGRLRPYLRKVILTTFEGHCSTELFPIKVNDKVNNKFLMYWLLSQRITDKINATWTGARMPRANMNKVLEFDISIPSIMEQQKIVVQLDELQEQTKKLEQIYEQKIKDLDELKQSILQKTFNGKL